jgi:hypothetical protein
MKVFVYTITDVDGDVLFVETYRDRAEAEWDRGNDIARDSEAGVSCDRFYYIWERKI